MNPARVGRHCPILFRLKHDRLSVALRGCGLVVERCLSNCDVQRSGKSELVVFLFRYDKSVQSYTKLYYLYYGTLTICLPVSSNPILLMLLSFGAALHRL